MSKPNRFRCRVWDGAKMYHDGFVVNPDGSVQWTMPRIHSDKSFVHDDDVVCMFSTGLLDSGGVEIFDGDIVRFRTKGGFSVRGVAAVRYFGFPYNMLALTGGAARYKFPSDEGKPLGSSGSSTPYKPYTWNTYKELSVIGNIYEQPELLDTAT